MTLAETMRHPFQTREQIGRILALTIVQLIPVVGQLILIGYGLEVVRTVQHRQEGWPPIRWLSALQKGGLILVTGLLYLLPILLIIPMSMTVGGGEDSGGIPLLVPILVFVVLPSLGRLAKHKPQLKRIVDLISRLVMLGILGTIVMRLFTVFQAGIDLTAFSLSGVNPLLLVGVGVAGYVITICLRVSGARYAVVGQGLFQPQQLLKTMMKNRPATGRLARDLLLLDVVMGAAVIIGGTLFVWPGLVALVVFCLAQSQRLAHYLDESGLAAVETV